MTSGYLINLFKYPPADVKSIDKNVDLKNCIAEGDNTSVRNIVWSNLDRMEIRRIDEFEQYRSSEKSEREWVGERQSAMLYDLVDDVYSKLRYRTTNEKEDRCRLRLEVAKECGQQERDKYRFFGISMVNFSPIMHRYIYEQENPGETIHKELGDILEELCNSDSAKFLNSYLEYEIYGTLGSADCAIVWLVNQYTDVISLVEALRKVKCTKEDYLTSNVYTIMGLTNPLSDSNAFENSKGIFNLRLIKRGSFDVEQFKKYLEKYVNPIKDINIVLGKYDVSVAFESSAINKNIYAENMPIHFRTDKYYKMILEAHTELMQKPGEEQIEPISYVNKEIKEEPVVFASDTLYEEVRKVIDEVTKAKIFNEMSYLKETIWLLYQDFVKIMASEFSYPWSVDLGYAFPKSIEYMSEILDEETKMDKSDIIDFIQHYINSIRQTILHISQASKLYFEVPDSHLKQTGPYSKVLNTYYGVIKHLLKIAYNIPKYDSQSEIIPFITFDVKPKVESEFFQVLNLKKIRVVNFELPYEALTDLPKYSKLLSHEVFHYIAPARRDVRNNLYGYIIWTETIKSICYQRFLSLYTLGNKKKYSYEEWKISCGKIIGHIKEDIWNAVLENSNNLLPELPKNETCFWSDYSRRIAKEIDTRYRRDESKILEIAKLIKDVWYKNADTLKNSNPSNKCFEAIVKVVNTAYKNDGNNEEFLYWFISSDAVRYMSTKASDIVDANREALADYFMIQTMNMPIEEYLSTTFDFAGIYQSSEQMQRMQQLRMGMVLDYIWSKKGELSDEKILGFIDNMDLTDKQKQITIELWDSYEKYAKMYRCVFGYLFEAIDFEEIGLDSNEKLRDEIKSFSQKVVVYASPQDEKDFLCNRNILEKMQKQDSLESLFEKKYLNRTSSRDLRKIDDIKKDLYILNVKTTTVSVEHGLSKSRAAVQSLEAFMKAFEDAVKELRDDNEEPLWFRGHSSSEYKLIPSLYRLKVKEEHAHNGSLKQIMEDLLSAFRVKSFGVPEIAPKGNDSYLNTAVSMQHYRVNTNLLDWSQQIFSALYFALEDYILDSKKSIPEQNARVYILNPSRYNMMMRDILGCSMVCGPYTVPSLPGDDAKFANYLPFMPVNASDGQEEKQNLPIAIYTPYVNPRIKTQAGCFTMFSLNPGGRPTAHEGMKFELENLQNRCKEKDSNKYKTFLDYIDIDRECVHEIANSVKTLGITRKYIYPELVNIAEEMQEEIKKKYIVDK